MRARQIRKKNGIETPTHMICLVFFTLLTIFLSIGCTQHEPESVRVEILHTLSGTMAESESSLFDSALLAIEEINEPGGVLGREIDTVIEDGKFEIVWESDILPPVNCPASRERSEWEQLLENLYQAWGRHWASPVLS